jgi:4-hydroxy-L-threonine phosphate dehydrogenase PdxA
VVPVNHVAQIERCGTGLLATCCRSVHAAPPGVGTCERSAAGRQAADCVSWAARAALRGEVAAMVTAPLHKEALAAAGVPYPGHTELLQAEPPAFWANARRRCRCA